jgi:tRNA nucleotidyltransferase/poly(A) polymerase
MPTTPREAAIDVVRALVRAGHVAYLAGGCVRDELLGIVPKDYDVATDAPPEEVARIFPNARGVGEAFGVQLVRRRGHTIEVATFRTDGAYADGRHPAAVEFSDAEHDAQRRDFTINGLFEDPITGTIIDHVGGRADLEAGVIRAIGDADARLREDRLRMLRAVRFAARFGFAIEEATASAIRAAAGDLRGVSRERIGQELRWMLSHESRAVAAWELQYLGLDRPVLAEPGTLLAPIRLGRLPDGAAYPLALAAWLLDRDGGAATPAARLERAGRWSAALILSAAEERDLRRALTVHAALRREWAQMGVAAQKRLAGGAGFNDGLLLLLGEDRQAFVDIRHRVQELAATGIAPPPLVDGDDLIAHGLRPGPLFGVLLDQLYDAQLEGSVRTQEEALALADAIIAAGDLGSKRGRAS